MTEKTKVSSPTTPMILISTTACRSHLESIPEYPLGNEDDGREGGEDSKENEPDTSDGSAVARTPIDYKNVLLLWKRRNHEPIVQRDSKSPSPPSGAATTLAENIPQADAIRERRSRRMLILQRFKKSTRNQTRNAHVAPLPSDSEPKFLPENHSIQKHEVSMVEGGSTNTATMDDSFEEEILEFEPSVTPNTFPPPVEMVDEVLEIEPSVTPDNSSSPVEVVDEVSEIKPNVTPDNSSSPVEVVDEVLEIEPSVTPDTSSSPVEVVDDVCEPSVKPDTSSSPAELVDEVLQIEPSVIPHTSSSPVEMVDEVLEIEPRVTPDTSSPVEVVDEGCNIPLHPAEQSSMVMILKPTASTRLGIQLICYGWRFVISRIDEASLLAQTDLQVGQTILAINGMAASDFPSPRAMLDALKVSRKVVIVATKSVLFSTTKAVGLVLDMSAWNTLYVSQVLVPNSTLRKGMTLITMNRTTNLDLFTANRILQDYQMGKVVRLSILALPTPVSSETVSNMPLYVDESCVTAQLLPSCPIELRKHDDCRITIAKIENHPKLRVGQTVLAVNGVPAYCFGSAAAMREMMSRCPALVFATNSILVSVIKPTVDAKVGIAFQHSKGTLRIHQIDPTGSFWGKLKEGMKVIGINGNPCPTSLEAANEMVKVCVGTLTIVAVDDDGDK